MRIFCLTTLTILIILANGYGDSELSKYSAIVQRNAFNLREPEPPKPPEAPPPSVSVKLTGITTLLNTKRVFLVVQEQGKQPESKMLQQGDKDGPIEVVEIDEINGKVKIINSGKEQVLDFEKDGIKPPTSPANQPPRPNPAVPGAMPLPGAVPASMPGTGVPTGAPPLPGAVIPGAPNPSANPTITGPSVSTGTVNPNASATTVTIPPNPRPVRLPGSKQ